MMKISQHNYVIHLTISLLIGAVVSWQLQLIFTCYSDANSPHTSPDLRSVASLRVRLPAVTLNQSYQNNIVPGGTTSRTNKAVTDEVRKPVRILCWLMTDPNILTKASYARDTWMKHCDVRLFMSSEYNAIFPTVGLNVSSGRQHISFKSKASWRYIYEHHRDDADFFMKADPDSFVIIDNLKEYLRHCNSSEPNLYGHALYLPLKSMPYFSGFYAAGAAIVLTRQAMVQLVTKGIDDQCFPNGQAEDLKTSSCLSKAGGHMVDTRDGLGRETFLPPFSISQIRWKKLPSWYRGSYRKPIGFCDNIGCLSDFPISFHYINQDTMFLMDYLVYTANFSRFNRDLHPTVELKFNGTILRPH